MTYVLEQVKAAVLAVAPDASILRTVYRWQPAINVANKSFGPLYVHEKGDWSVASLVSAADRGIIRAIIDELDRQDAARESTP